MLKQNKLPEISFNAVGGKQISTFALEMDHSAIKSTIMGVAKRDASARGGEAAGTAFPWQYSCCLIRVTHKHPETNKIINPSSIVTILLLREIH